MLAGRTINGRYDVLELIASGGMGEVYRARDRELDELVALKVIRTDRADPEMVERFRSEVKLARRVTHANVARTFELGYADGAIFCTMELVEGETLAQRLGRGRIAVAEAIGIATAVCDALVAAHAADVIHRDIKPANVLIAPDGRVVLADFGIAAAQVAGDTETSGTPAYMAPEQAAGERSTFATDVYAIGVVLYEMLTGKRAFIGSLAQIVDAKRSTVLRPTGGDVSPDLADVVSRATAPKVDDRIRTAAELRHALSPWATTTQAPMQPRRIASPALDARTVIVIAPRATKDERAHVAFEIHEQLLAALARSTLRVLPRTEETVEPARFVVRFEVKTDLVMSVTATDAPAFTLVLPLAAERISEAVELAASAVHAAADAKPEPHGEAYDLWLRARQEIRIGPARTTEALAFAERALTLQPDDPKIQALTASLLCRVAFFQPVDDHLALARAGKLVRAAADRGFPDAHIAAGHYELHTGDATIAASHYRRAIAQAPYLAEAHEHLGRLLIEAGYLDAAFARFDDAFAIAPNYAMVQWELARAWALEGRWDEYDRLTHTIDMGRRVLAVGRASWWRGDMATLRKIRVEAQSPLWNDLVQPLFDAFLDDAWPRVGDKLVQYALTEQSASKRRRTFISQLVSEAAAHAGEIETSLQMISRAADFGLYDLHWLDRVPTLAKVRASPLLTPIRARIEARARGIYDALYGDHAMGTSETLPATS